MLEPPRRKLAQSLGGRTLGAVSRVFPAFLILLFVPGCVASAAMRVTSAVSIEGSHEGGLADEAPEMSDEVARAYTCRDDQGWSITRVATRMEAEASCADELGAACVCAPLRADE